MLYSPTPQSQESLSSAEGDSSPTIPGPQPPYPRPSEEDDGGTYYCQQCERFFHEDELYWASGESEAGPWYRVDCPEGHILLED